MLRCRADFVTQDFVPHYEIWGSGEKKPMREAPVFFFTSGWHCKSTSFQALAAATRRARTVAAACAVAVARTTAEAAAAVTRTAAAAIAAVARITCTAAGASTCGLVAPAARLGRSACT